MNPILKLQERPHIVSAIGAAYLEFRNLFTAWLIIRISVSLSRQSVNNKLFKVAKVTTNRTTVKLLDRWNIQEEFCRL